VTPKHAYIGSFTSAGGHGLTTVAVDAETGALGSPVSTEAVDDPSFLALSPSGELLYTVSERPEGGGGAAVFSLDDPSAPRQLGKTLPVGGAAPTHLCLAEGHLLTANYGSGSVSVIALDVDGGPLGVRDVLRHRGGGPDLDRQEGPHAHMVLPDPSGRRVLSVDLGTDSVRVCRLDAGTGELRVERETVLRAGTGPRHLAFHPRGDRAYVIHELEPVVTACRWDADAGQLRPVSEVSLPPGGAGCCDYPSELVVSEDGRFAWAALRGDNSIAVLALDAEGDRLELRGSVGCGGDWPRHLTLDPSGRRLYAANERSGEVAWFDVDPATGMPRQAGSIGVPAASCLVFG
jgi:6-phosphogluconolactonase